MDGGGTTPVARRAASVCRAVARGEAGAVDVLDLLHDGFGDLASLSVIDPRARQGTVHTRGRPPITGEEERGWERLLPAHPYWTHVLTETDPAPRLTDVVDIRSFTGTEVYDELLRPWGARYHAMVVLERSPTSVQVLSLWRHRRDFSAAEVAGFVQIARTFAAAAAYRAALAELDPEAPSARRPTARQRQVVELVARGLTNQQIGHRLEVSPRTVRKHLESLFALAGARSRTELAVWWREEGGRGPVVSPADP